LNLQEITVQPIQPGDEKRFQSLMNEHHYLGALPKIGHTVWYIACYHDSWVALISFSAAAWKCAARDQWIGWRYRYQYDRLHLVANNSRFLILPKYHITPTWLLAFFLYANSEFLKIGRTLLAIPYYC
jgi:hypothetical protein